jgi:hypothetical protein
MKVGLKAVIALLAAVGALGLSARAFGQAAELPYYAERVTKQNVMLMFDISGSMAWAGELGTNPRNRMDVVKDVLTGKPVHDTDQKVVYTTHSGSLSGLFSILDDVVDSRTMGQIFRVDYVSATGEYTADDQGDWFVFLSKAPLYQDDTNDDVTAAQSTLSAYLRLKGKTCIHYVSTTDVDNDSASVDRDIYQAVDCSATTGVRGDMTFYDALKAFYWYNQIGQATIADVYVVPVTYKANSASTTWVDPSTSAHLTRKGLCYTTKNKSTTDSQFFSCYKPSVYTGTDNFVFYQELQDGVSVTQGEEAENNKVLFSDWATARTAVAICPVNTTTTYEVWGDKPYSQWTWYNNCSSGCLPYYSPRSDGNTPKKRQIWKKCGLTSTGAVPALFPPSDAYIQNSMVNGATVGATPITALPKVTALDKSQPLDGVTGPEFKLTTSGTRIDIYLRTKRSVSPTSPATSTIDLHDPSYGDFFSPDGKLLYYDYLVYKADVGILDLYKDVNYGVMAYDNQSSGTHDDFPPTPAMTDPCSDGHDHCMGAKLLKGLTTYAGFPAYASLTTDALNNDIRNFIRHPNNLKVWYNSTSTSGSTPIAAAIHDAVRYFYYSAYESGMAGRDTDPTMFYDLGYPNALNPTPPLTNTNAKHIVQGEPFYTSGCRRNFLIFLTDGEQTDGEPLNGYVGDPTDTQLASIITSQKKYVKALVKPPDTNLAPKAYGVKPFFIGFGPDVASDNAVAELNAMALASAMPGDTSGHDRTTPFMASDPAALQKAFGDIMNQIMLGHYARTAPKISQSQDIILTNYFDIDPTYPLWKGHLLGWKVSDTSSMVKYWTGTPGNDIANILLAQTAADRKIFTAVNSSLAVLPFTAAKVYTGSDLKTTIDPISLYSVTEIQNTVNLMRGTTNVKFQSGATVTSRLGPTFHSVPRIMTNPSTIAYGRFPKYNTFKSDHASRPPVIFVGTGMGMIHAFGLASGSEIFAYVPKPVLKYLPNLYKGLQIYGVDASPVTDDVYGNFGAVTGDTQNWRTILVSGMGGGGTDYVALDVTNITLNPSVSDGSTMPKPLWNFGDPGKLGYTWSVPVMGPIRYLDSGNTVTRTAIFFGGGMSTDPNLVEENHGAKFYIADAVDGNTFRADWTMTAYNKFTDFTDPPDYVNINGVDVLQGGTNQSPGSPIINDSDGDGYYDHAYEGDLQGRIWKFDFHDPDPDNWKKCLLYDVTDLNFAGAKGNDSDRRPIWYTPTLVNGSNGNLIIYFSSGHVETFEAANDAINRNRLFAVVDPAPLGGCTYGVKMSEAFAGVVADSDWPLLLDKGEKLLSSPMVVDQKVIFKTYNPTTTDYCNPGTVRLYAINYLTGDAVFDFNGDGKIDDSDKFMESSNLSNTDLTMDSSGNIFQTTTAPGNSNDTLCIGSNVGEYCQVWRLYIDQAHPMSWGEGVSWK